MYDKVMHSILLKVIQNICHVSAIRLCGLHVCYTLSVGFVSKGWGGWGKEKHRPRIHHSYKYNYKLIHHNLKTLVQQKTKKVPMLILRF